MSPTDNPWPLFGLLLVGAVTFGVLWMWRRQWGWLAGCVLCVALSIVPLIIDGRVETTRELVARNVRELARAFQQRDLDRTIQYVSPQAKTLRMLIGTAHNILEIEDDMRITDVQVELKGEETRATARFRVNATFVAHVPGYPESSDRVPTRWESKWQMEGDRWQMIDIIELDPISGARKDSIDVVRFMVEKIYPDR